MKLGKGFDAAVVAATAAGFVALWFAATVIRTPDLILFFLPWLIVAAIVVVTLYLGWRRRYVALLALTAVGSAAVLPVWAERSPMDGGRMLRVTTANLLSESNGDKQGLRRWLEGAPADIVLVQEAPHQESLFKGIKAYPVVIGPYSWDVAILSRYPIVGEPTILTDGVLSRKRGIRVEFDVTDRSDPSARRETVVVYNIHAQTPRSKERWRERNRLLEVVATSVAREAPGTRVIVGGDFNTPRWSPWWSRFRDTSGLVAADRSLWPVATRYFREFKAPEWFGSTIDHVFVSPGIDVDRHRVGPNIGSDHLPVTVDLTLD